MCVNNLYNTLQNFYHTTHGFIFLSHHEHKSVFLKTLFLNGFIFHIGTIYFVYPKFGLYFQFFTIINNTVMNPLKFPYDRLLEVGVPWEHINIFKALLLKNYFLNFL